MWQTTATHSKGAEKRCVTTGSAFGNTKEENLISSLGQAISEPDCLQLSKDRDSAHLQLTERQNTWEQKVAEKPQTSYWAIQFWS